MYVHTRQIAIEMACSCNLNVNLLNTCYEDVYKLCVSVNLKASKCVLEERNSKLQQLVLWFRIQKYL